MPKPDVSEKRKTKILSAAREIFARKPLKDVKMQDIAHSGESDHSFRLMPITQSG